MIEIKNISKSFNDKKVLHSISGKFEKGKTNLIIGASGTGKSVLLKCLVGLLNPDKGRVIFDDRVFTEKDKSTTTQIRREIGMLFQGSALFDSKNVEENIKFPLDLLTEISEKEKIEKVNHCLNLVGLNKINQKIVKSLKSISNDNSSNEIDVIISSSKEKRILSKNKSGKAEIFELRINLNVTYLNRVKTLNMKQNYSNVDNKFQLKEYEKIIEKQLIDELVNSLINYLTNFK